MGYIVGLLAWRATLSKWIWHRYACNLYYVAFLKMYRMTSPHIGGIEHHSCDSNTCFISRIDRGFSGVADSTP